MLPIETSASRGRSSRFGWRKQEARSREQEIKKDAPNEASVVARHGIVIGERILRAANRKKTKYRVRYFSSKGGCPPSISLAHSRTHCDKASGSANDAPTQTEGPEKGGGGCHRHTPPRRPTPLPTGWGTIPTKTAIAPWRHPQRTTCSRAGEHPTAGPKQWHRTRRKHRMTSWGETRNRW